MTEDTPDDENIVVGSLPPPGMSTPPGSKVSLLYSPRSRVKKSPPRDVTKEQLARRWGFWEQGSYSANIRKLEDDASYYFPVTIQQLGHLDIELIQRDVAYERLSNDEKKSPQKRTRQFANRGLASFWVMAGFQVIYTLEARMADRNVKFRGLHGQIADTRAAFTQLRSPLAKGKPSPRQRPRDSAPRADYQFPWHAIRVDGSTCWFVNPKVLASRLDLSNKLLSLLINVANHGHAALLPLGNSLIQIRNIADVFALPGQPAPNSTR